MLTSKEIKHIITEQARLLGFDDVQFYKSPLPEAGNTAVLLFMGYVPSDSRTAPGRIALSPYYPCSHAAYMAAKELVSELSSRFNIHAERTNAVHYKGLAASKSGRIGLNSLYYHDKLGSFLSMQCLVLNLDDPPENVSERDAACLRCGACITACPLGAISEAGWEREKCLRHLFNTGVPEYARAYVYELLGCEKCQLCCPMNTATRKLPMAFDLKDVIEGRYTKELKAIAGSNMATRTKLLTQAMCFAVANGQIECLDIIKTLVQDNSAVIREIAKWAKEKLETVAGKNR